MLPDPLHPAVVHFPLVLSFLLPLFAAGALWAIKRGAKPARAWGLTVAAAAALTLSAWVALETGESQEERVEDAVGEAPLNRHEEAAEMFLAASAGLLLLVGVGLAPGLAGKAARIAGTAGAVALVGAAAWVGHSGGELVYRHGAASAYTSGPAGGRGENAGGEVRDRDRDER